MDPKTGSVIHLAPNDEYLTQQGPGTSSHEQSTLCLTLEDIYSDGSFWRVLLENVGRPAFVAPYTSYETFHMWSVWAPIGDRPQWGYLSGLKKGAISGGLQEWIIVDPATSPARHNGITTVPGVHVLDGRRGFQVVFCRPGFQREAPQPTVLQAFRDFIGYHEDGSGYPAADLVAKTWTGDASSTTTNMPARNLGDHLHHPRIGYPSHGHPFQLGTTPSQDAGPGGGNSHNATILHCLATWATWDDLDAYQLALLLARHKATMGWVLPGDGSLWESWADTLCWFEKTGDYFPGSNYRPYQSHSWMAGILWSAAFSGDPLLARVSAKTLEYLRKKTIYKRKGAIRKADRAMETLYAAYKALGDDSIKEDALWLVDDVYSYVNEGERWFQLDRLPVVTNPWMDGGYLWRVAQWDLEGALSEDQQAKTIDMAAYLAENCVEQGLVAYEHYPETGRNRIEPWPSISGFSMPLLWWLATKTGDEAHRRVAADVARVTYENPPLFWPQGHAVKKGGQWRIGYYQRALREVRDW